MKKRLALIWMTIVTFALLSAGAQAGPILCAVGGTVDSGGPGFGTLTETIDQSGLSSGYTCGVTDFDTYIGTGPTHTLVFAGNEWFSNSGTTSAVVTYDLGVLSILDGLALWNEESSGIGLLNLLGSINGIDFFSLASGLLPTDNPLADYGADVFSFASTALQYVRFEMSDCPQIDPGSFNACAIGEVAFRQGVSVPEPGTLALLGIGLFGMGLARRNKKA